MLVSCICLFLWVTGQPQAIDTLIVNGTVVTVDSTSRVIPKGMIAVDKGVILEIGNVEAAGKYKARQVIDASGSLVMPGLINTHTHSPMALFRGFSDDVPLKEWLEKFIWPAEAKFIDANTVRLGSQLAAVEMIRSGTTTFNDLYFYVDTIAEVVEEAGLRAILAESLIDFATPHKKTPDETMAYIRRMLEKWKNHPRVTMAVGAHSPYTCSPELLKNARALASEFNAPLHLHLSETETEVIDIQKRYGATPTGHLANLGVLYEGLIAAHGVHLTSQDMELIAKHGVGLAHNPESNMKLASGVMNVSGLLKLTDQVGLATDGVASNNDLNMFESMDFAAKLQKLTHGSQSVNAEAMVRMATINGARALGMDRITGSLESGKRADLIIIPLDRPHLTPFYDAWSHIVYSVKGSDVATVMVDGKLLMIDHKLQTLDEDAIIKGINSIAAQIRDHFFK